MDKDNLGFADDEERKAFYIALPVIALFGGLLYYFVFTPEQDDSLNLVASNGTTVGRQLDSDADGIADTIDRCIDESGSIENQGCLYAADRTSEDKAENTKASQRSSVKNGVAVAAPLEQVELIEDESLALETNVPDASDVQTIQQPEPEPEPEPEPKPVPEPTPAPIDTDDDGLFDVDDDCPNTAGTQGNNGCPPDTDADGIADFADKCPDIAGDADNSGCPVPPAAIADVQEDAQPSTSITLTPAQPVSASAERLIQDAGFSIQFNEGNATLTGRSKEILLEVANVMTRYPSLLLEAHGFTDSNGAEQVNKALSQARAQSCIDIIAEAGIDRERLSAIGFGEAQPIASNDTKGGRQKNRRVEFKLIR